MKRVPLITAMLLALCASTASAFPGLNLGWNLACPTTASSSAQMSDPCDSNRNSYTLIGSVKAPAGLSKVTAEEIVVDLQEVAPQVSPWWHLEDESATTPAGCRGSSASKTGSLSLTAAFAGASTTVCKDYWGTSASGSLYYVTGYGGVNRARLEALFARTVSTAGPLTANTQYYVFNANLDTNHTVPDPTDPTVYVCPGCQDVVCIVFNSCKFDQPPGTPSGDIEVNSEDLRYFASWQIDVYSACFPTPTRRATWGKVKSLYR